MNELVVIVEGATEQTFVRDILAGHLVHHGTTTWPVFPGRHRQHGGVKAWKVARDDIVRTLKERRYCSTMFDYYGLPDDWPGRVASRARPWHERASHVEQEIHDDIVAVMGGKFDGRFFVPYIQLHEFEALAFADVASLASVVQPVSKLTLEQLETRFQRILDEATHPEAINDSFETCPSRRITKIVPAYLKRSHGPIVTKRIAMDVLRKRCDHFASWMERLEQIGQEGV